MLLADANSAINYSTPFVNTLQDISGNVLAVIHIFSTPSLCILQFLSWQFLLKIHFLQLWNTLMSHHDSFTKLIGWNNNLGTVCHFSMLSNVTASSKIFLWNCYSGSPRAFQSCEINFLKLYGSIGRVTYIDFADMEMTWITACTFQGKASQSGENWSFKCLWQNRHKQNLVNLSHQHWEAGILPQLTMDYTIMTFLKWEDGMSILAHFLILTFLYLV